MREMGEIVSLLWHFYTVLAYEGAFRLRPRRLVKLDLGSLVRNRDPDGVKGFVRVEGGPPVGSGRRAD
jgi:hypothetical protein